MNKKNILIFTAGLAAGILMSLLLFQFRSHTGEPQVSALQTDATRDAAQLPESDSASQSAAGSEAFDLQSMPETADVSIINSASGQEAASGGWQEWSADTVYNGGDQVIYQNKIYRARWWTQNETPGSSDVWEDTLETPAAPSSSHAAPGPDADKNYVPISGAKDDSPKVVAYYPSWNGEQFQKLQYDILTHVVYAFAIPNADGTLKPLENPDLARKLIQDAHQHQVKVLLAVGGWSYLDTPLEPTFVSATSDQKKREEFGDRILEMCNTYGFDGIDLDWEHPRADGASSAQYEALILYLAERLHADGKLLTSAVVSGATADGNIYYDAAAHTDKVLNAVDWIHVMAYDGGDGDRHSSYEFAVNCGTYWKDTRHIPASKVVLGVPFYARPGWASYGDILDADPNAWNSDISQYNGMEAHYNGVATIQKKTRYAADNLGGIMIWEITQDTANREKSLLTAIGQALK